MIETTKVKAYSYSGPLKTVRESFVREKRALGYLYGLSGRPETTGFSLRPTEDAMTQGAFIIVFASFYGTPESPTAVGEKVPVYTICAIRSAFTACKNGPPAALTPRLFCRS